jgi:hypothetical protein
MYQESAGRANRPVYWNRKAVSKLPAWMRAISSSSGYGPITKDEASGCSSIFYAQ